MIILIRSMFYLTRIVYADAHTYSIQQILIFLYAGDFFSSHAFFLLLLFLSNEFFFLYFIYVFSRLCVICSIVFYWHIERFSTQRISLFAWICRLFFHLLDLILIVFASSTSFVLYKVFIWYACHTNVSASERVNVWMK